MQSTLKKLVKSGAILLLGFACGLAFVNFFYTVSSKGKKEAFFDISFDEVLLIIFKSETTSLVAHRKSEADGFFLHVINSEKSEKCYSSSNLSGHLEEISNLRSDKSIDIEDLKIKFPKYIGKLEMRDKMVQVDIDPIYFFASSDGSKIAAKHSGVSGEVGLSMDVFRALEAGCRKLALR